ncbi:MAG: hypothetical protein ABIT96_10375 [Ferruginibacter sp.]
MLIKLFFTATSFFLAVSCTAQENVSDSIVRWADKGKITWQEFTVKDTNERFAAESLTFFKANFFLKDDSVFCQVITYLNKNQSWRKPTISENDDYGINHEQMHFNITELFAREVRKSIIDHDLNEQQVKKIYMENAKACRAFQELYDSETRHSLDREKQAFWNSKIERLLSNLEAFKEQFIFIKNPWCKPCWKDQPMIAASF